MPLPPRIAHRVPGTELTVVYFVISFPTPWNLGVAITIMLQNKNLVLEVLGSSLRIPPGGEVQADAQASLFLVCRQV